MQRGVAVAVHAAAVLLAWTAMLAAEDVVLGFTCRHEFSAAWEVAAARNIVIPMAVLGLAPAAVVVALAWRLVLAGEPGTARAARPIVTMVGAALAGTLALGISGGRHFDAWAIRGPFVALVTLSGGLAVWFGLHHALRIRSRPIAMASVGALFVVAGWTADAFILPRLYPAFHAAMAFVSMAGGALVAICVVDQLPLGRHAALAFAGAVSLAVVAGAAALGPLLGALDRATNMRIVLVEHAPLLGRVVMAAERLAPRAPEVAAAGAMPSEPKVGRTLDWSGHDLVLITVDALRADHVSAYGYERQTTPHLDALAHEGTLFDAAYCATPHTSYSITSMMTGKYLRPLVALGLGSDSETWAELLRRYGWRTAAFYPPAVFFVDENHFSRFEKDRLGFEYAKVEFADPALRDRQVAEYLAGAPADRPLFLWVHFFEPHEPYVRHPEHVFGANDTDLDAYDSEIATADDGIGRIVGSVRARRPGAVFLVTGDHGEEFGEHGGRYHGTTVYEEQVRVPLVVVGPGVREGARAATVVQTIDMMPTALSALDIPIPARVRGRDLGAVLSGREDDAGFAFAETDDQTLVASGADRLICERRAAACALYDRTSDVLERRDLSSTAAPRFDALRARLSAVVRDHGRFERAGVDDLPEALRRGLQGQADAARDVASLLDDARVSIRRQAASVCFDLRAPETLPMLRRAVATDEDEVVRRWCSLGLVRLGDPVSPAVEALLADPDGQWRRRAALALAERGDGRACEEIGAWWADIAPKAGQATADGEPPRVSIDMPQALDLLAATGRARCRSAVASLVGALGDVRLRSHVADCLGSIGDARAAAPLLERLSSEPYATARPHEARALLALGVHDWASAEPASEARLRLSVPDPARPARLVVLVSGESDDLRVSSGGAKLVSRDAVGLVRLYDVETKNTSKLTVELSTAGSGGIAAVWLAPGRGGA